MGDPGSIKLRNVFPLVSVLPKLTQLPYGVTKGKFFMKTIFLQVSLFRYLGVQALSEIHSRICLPCGGVYFVFLRQEGYRKPPGKHFVIHGQIMENRSMENPWKIQCKNHGKNHGKLNGKSMENPWKIKTEKKEMFPWYSMPHKKRSFLGSKIGIRFDTKWHHN